jgi:hypothetical protein
MIVEKLRNIGDLSIGQRGLQAVYVVKNGVHLVWRKLAGVYSAWFHHYGWSHDRGWFHS